MSEEREYNFDVYKDGDPVWYVQEEIGGDLVKRTIDGCSGSNDSTVVFKEDSIKYMRHKWTICRRDDFRGAIRLMEQAETVLRNEIDRRKHNRTRFEKEFLSNGNQPE